ncbi:DUF3558 domain-containing protein [Nocardia sp. NPDC050712]|uniref:DUF3558 domain-containing protein n=1 Tax=Nocardia sp. NPDC050712 TaxID=3155518 RepID=UPI0033CAB002
MRKIAAAAGVCAVVLVAGCSSTVGGSGGPESSPASTGAKLTKDQLWDPCSLPDSVITSTGADPATKDPDPALGERGEWKICQWRASKSDGRWGHYIAVSSTTYTMDEFRKNTYYRDFRSTQVAGREALQFYLGSRQPPLECALAFDTSQGVVRIKASKFVDSETTTDPCALAMPAAEKIVDLIPR